MSNRQANRKRDDVTARARRRTQPARPGSRSGRSQTRDSSASRVHGARPVSGSTQPALSKIRLCVHAVKCVKTTREVIARDKMALSAALVDGTGRARKGKTLQVGKFRKGDVETYPRGKMVAEWALGQRNQGWPRRYEAALLFLEQDRGPIAPVLNACVKTVEEQVKKELTKVASEASMAAAGAIGGAIGTCVPAVGTAVGTAVGIAVDLAAKEIKRAREHDCFPPKVARLTLTEQPSKKGELPDSRKTVRFEAFGAIYTLECSFQAA